MKLKALFPYFFIVVLIFMVYSNTFHAAWQFDDYNNILNNQNVQMNELSFENIKKSFRGGDGMSVLRAIPRLSLAINWYFGENKVFGYHLFNIVIHCISSCALFLLIYHLIGSVYPKNKWKYDIAILSALLWALHPIQISAVTYIVQRMASMAAMFYILSLLFYVYGRRSLLSKDKSMYRNFLFSAVFSICAMFSKQNAFMLPASIGLLEIIVFKNTWILQNKYRLYKILFVLFSTFLLFLIYFHSDSLFNLLFYENRPFNAYERCLTQFRVLILYLSLIVFPVTSRFSIEHYFKHSTSLFEPISTLFCFCIIIILLFTAFYSRKKYPFLSFALFFYFINHFIESSFLSLELVFEHRNYLPSIFLFVPLVLLIHELILRNKKTRFLCSIFICALLIVLGVSTYNRNYVWNDLGGLWADALKTSPDSGRVLFNYAALNLVPQGKHQDALNCFLASSNMGWHRQDQNKAVPFSRISGLLKSRDKDKEALDYARKALVNKPYQEDFVRDLLLLQLRNKLWDAADFTSDLLLDFNPKNPEFLNYKGFVLLKRDDPENALKYFHTALNNDLLNKNALVNTGYALNVLGNYKQAELVFKIAHINYPENSEILYQLLNNSLESKSSRSKYYCTLILKKFTFVQIYDELKDRPVNPLALRLNSAALADFITETLNEI